MARRKKRIDYKGGMPIYGETMKRKDYRVPDYMREWLKGQPEGASATIRALIQEEMDKEKSGKHE